MFGVVICNRTAFFKVFELQIALLTVSRYCLSLSLLFKVMIKFLQFWHYFLPFKCFVLCCPLKLSRAADLL